MAWAPDYATEDSLRAYLRTDIAADGAQIALAISASSRAIDRTTNRQFGQVDAPEARYYTARWDRRRCRWVIEMDDLMTTTGLLIKSDLDEDGDYTDAIDQYRLEPANAAQKGRPWTHIVVLPSSTNQPTGDPDGVEVFAQPGWTDIPTPVEQACLLQSSRFFARRDAPFGVAGSPEAGSELRLLAKVDPDVAVALGSYTRWWGAR